MRLRLDPLDDFRRLGHRGLVPVPVGERAWGRGDDARWAGGGVTRRQVAEMHGFAGTDERQADDDAGRNRGNATATMEERWQWGDSQFLGVMREEPLIGFAQLPAQLGDGDSRHAAVGRRGNRSVKRVPLARSRIERGDPASRYRHGAASGFGPLQQLPDDLAAISTLEARERS